MSSINTHVGKMIRKYRKAANLTLQQLADAIHKSRATICKYENGDMKLYTKSVRFCRCLSRS